MLFIYFCSYCGSTSSNPFFFENLKPNVLLHLHGFRKSFCIRKNWTVVKILTFCQASMAEFFFARANGEHCVKSVQIRSCFWSVISFIRTEYSKMRTRKNSAFGHFSLSVKTVNYFPKKDIYRCLTAY